MKGKIQFATIAVSVFMGLAVCLSGCGETVETEHEHTFATAWVSDKTHHWHTATCEHKSEISGKAEHSFEDGVCTVCDYAAEVLGLSFSEINGDFHSTKQTNYIAGDYNKIGNYAQGTQELSKPDGVRVVWRVEEGMKSVDDIGQFKLIVSTSETFATSTVYEIEPSFAAGAIYQRYTLQNLLLDTSYYLKIQAFDERDTVLSEATGSFRTTAYGPRNLNVDGVTNVRDIGGYAASNGQTVKQGMLIRCGRLNKSEQTNIEIEITEEGKRVMREELGIRYEIDLRGEFSSERGGITSSPLGEDVGYAFIPMKYTTDHLAQKSLVRDTFEILADESNYPIIFHCNIGTDRTGFIAFLCNALLGVSETDLYRDYLFSNFGNIGGSRDQWRIDNYILNLSSYDGNSLSERVESYLLSCGITAEQISSFKQIMLG